MLSVLKIIIYNFITYIFPLQQEVLSAEICLVWQNLFSRNKSIKVFLTRVVFPLKICKKKLFDIFVLGFQFYQPIIIKEKKTACTFWYLSVRFPDFSATHRTLCRMLCHLASITWTLLSDDNWFRKSEISFHLKKIKRSIKSCCA